MIGRIGNDKVGLSSSTNPGSRSHSAQVIPAVSAADSTASTSVFGSRVERPPRGATQRCISGSAGAVNWIRSPMLIEPWLILVTLASTAAEIIPEQAIQRPRAVAARSAALPDPLLRLFKESASMKPVEPEPRKSAFKKKKERHANGSRSTERCRL